MDTDRFDRFARSFAAAGSRRGFVRLLSILPAAGIFALLWVQEAGGKRRRLTLRRRRQQRSDRVRSDKKKRKKQKKRRPSPGCVQACAGCCSGDTCAPGTSAAACGSGGAACAVCSGVQHLCLNGTCRCDVCASGCPYPTVQAAVADPAGPSTIRICAGAYTGSVAIDRDVHLIGAGDGNGAGDTILTRTDFGSVVTVNTGRTVTLERLRITGGNNPFGVGGGINTAGRVTLTHCTVAENSARAGGGGGIVNIGRLTLDASHVTGNQAGDTGGASDGGGIVSVSFGSVCRVTLQNGSTVSGNSASGSGGGISNGSGCTLTLLGGSSIVGNDAANGGGIRNDGTLTLIDSDVTDNTAINLGGGIYNTGATSLLDDSSITGNEANSAAGSGGGIYNQGTVNPVGGANTGNTPDDCVNAGGTGCPP
jgi:hypothetical protein